MTFPEFIKTYDHKDSVILLEGKRKVLEEDKQKLVSLGKLLASKSRHMKFRSGNADGADYLFSMGVAAVDKDRLEIIAPYKGHRKNYRISDNLVSIDEINLSAEPEVIYHSKTNVKSERLIDQYLKGNKKGFAIKGAYLIRDTIKVIGSSEIQAAGFAIFYEDLRKPLSGGTGHTMNVCRQNKIPFIVQSVWFEWLKNETEK